MGIERRTPRLDLYSKVATTPLTHFTNNIPNKTIRGVINPLDKNLEISLEVSGIAYGITQFYFDLAYQIDQATPGTAFDIHNVTAYTALNAKHMASLNMPGGSPRRPLRLTGLTPGKLITYEVYLNDATYANQFAVTNPAYLAVLDRMPASGTISMERYVAVVHLASTTLDILQAPLFPGQRTWSKLITTITLPANGYYPFFTKDGKYLFVGCTNGNLVQIDTSTWTVTRTITTLPASTLPQFGVSLEDSSKVWVIDAGANNQVVPVTVSSGAVGTPLAIAAGSLRRPTKKPGTDDIYIPSGGATGKLTVVDGVAASIKSTLTLSTNTPTRCAFAPDGSKCYVYSNAGTAKIQEVTTTSTPVLSGRSITVSGILNLAVDPGGGSLVAITASTYYWWDIANLAQYDSASHGVTDAVDMAMSNDGAIFISRNSENTLFCWPGGSLTIDTETGGGRASWCELRAWPALAGTND